MALITKYKKISTNLEVKNSYMKVITVTQNLLGENKHIIINVGFYVNEESRNNNLDLFDTECFTVGGEEYDKYFSEDVLKSDKNSLLTQCYKYIKEKKYGKSTDK